MRGFLANAMRRADEEHEARLLATPGTDLPGEVLTAAGAGGEPCDPETALEQGVGLVAREGPQSVADVAEALGLSAPTAWRRLNRLTRAGRLRIRRSEHLPARWGMP